MQMDWIQFGILIATILIPTIGGIMHVLQMLWSIKHMIKTMENSHRRTRKTVIRHDQQISEIRGHLGMFNSPQEGNRNIGTE